MIKYYVNHACGQCGVERGTTMDPITHAAIGAGVFALSGGDISLAEPALIGCIVGSVAPDLDIAAKVYNDYYYLKYHRGSSHSFVGILLMSFFLTAVLNFFYSSSFFSLFIWTFVGGLTHILFDFLNSYGAQLLWPISRKKYSLSLLKIFDIVIILLGISAIIYGKGNVLIKGGITTAFGLYVVLLGIMRNLAKQKVSDFYKGRVEVKSIKVLPAFLGFFDWDFVMMSQKHTVVGSVDLLRGRIMICERLSRQQKKEAKKFINNRVAGFFKEFTPIYHVKVKKSKGMTEVLYTDLRYRTRNSFMHHATAVFNPKGMLVECIFHPFNKNKRVPF
jgi:inner membrane protein